MVGAASPRAEFRRRARLLVERRHPINVLVGQALRDLREASRRRSPFHTDPRDDERAMRAFGVAPAYVPRQPQDQAPPFRAALVLVRRHGRPIVAELGNRGVAAVRAPGPHFIDRPRRVLQAAFHPGLGDQPVWNGCFF